MTWKEYIMYALRCDWDRVGCTPPILWMCLVLVLLLCACKTQYVPVETVRTEYKTKTDTFIQKDTVEREKTITIMEADSTLLSKYGILLRENRNTQATYLVIQKELERKKSSKQEVHRDTINKTDSVQVPYPVERKLTKWETFCLDYGKVMTGCTIALFVTFIFLVIRWFGRKRST